MIERACEIMDQYILRNPPSFAEFVAQFNQPGDDHVLKFMVLGAAADSAEYFFESDIMQAAACALGLIGTFRGPRDAGTGYVKLYHAMGMATGKRGAWAYLRGAMGSFTQALKKVALGLGVEIRPGTEVHHICVEGGQGHRRGDDRWRGVSLAVGPFERRSGADVYEAGRQEASAGRVCARHREHPDYLAGDEDQPGDGSAAGVPRPAQPRLSLGQLGGVHIGPSIDYLQRAYEDARQGRPADWPFFSIHAQSAVDRSLAPEGSETFSIFTQFFPYELAEGTWDERREEIARNAIARFAHYAPNMADAEITMQVLAPPDVEARFGLTGGHIFQGELVPEQAFDMRPVPGSQSYEGPISGLYLCGSGAWPGGCVMGAPGHNAAHEAIGRLRAGEYA